MTIEYMKRLTKTSIVLPKNHSEPEPMYVCIYIHIEGIYVCIIYTYIHQLVALLLNYIYIYLFIFLV